jgi:hypothetical protein
MAPPRDLNTVTLAMHAFELILYHPPAIFNALSLLLLPLPLLLLLLWLQ